MKTILATAYAINPYKGSEDGMGWNFVIQIARFNKVIAITRKNNRPHIEKFISDNPNQLYRNINFLYFDLPYWMRFWKKGGRGAMLYYLMWQKGIVSFIKSKNLEYDIVHNLNFHNDWSPSFLWKLNKPFVWGPVGHHPEIPKQYLEFYANSYSIKDQFTWKLKQFFWNFSPALKRTKKKANHIFCMNSASPKQLKLKANFSIMPSVATQDFGWNEEKENKDFIVISAGRFVPLKGFDLTIQAFAKFFEKLDRESKKNSKLILVGKGPEENELKCLVKSLEIEEKVEFISWIERNELMKMFKNASAFLFPSHEGAGMVVAEALSFGLPVICLDNKGPGEFINNDVGFKIPHSSYTETIIGLSNALINLHEQKFNNEIRKAARNLFLEKFHWDRRGEQLAEVYKSI
jgi:glycosyltransferase involved in cell wall biosynthesis